MLVSTVSTDVTISSLQWSDNQPITLVHPVVDFDLGEYYTSEDLAGAFSEIQGLIDAGSVTLKTASGVATSVASQGASIGGVELHSVASSGDYSDLNNKPSTTGRKQVINTSGRLYCYSNERWISSNPSYGPTYYQWAENAGNAATPIREWEHRGFQLPTGTVVKSIKFEARTNSAEVTGLRVAAYIKNVDLQDDALTIDTDAEANYFEVITPTDIITQASSSQFRDMRQGDISGIDITLPQTGELVLYLKPLGNMTSTRFIYFSMLLEVELP